MLMIILNHFDYSRPHEDIFKFFHHEYSTTVSRYTDTTGNKILLLLLVLSRNERMISKDAQKRACVFSCGKQANFPLLNIC